MWTIYNKYDHALIIIDQYDQATIIAELYIMLLIKGTDHVYSWGNGSSGQLGNGTCSTTIKPMLVPLTLDSKIQGMSCGARHSFIWTNNGYCYSFGNNFNAQLGYNFSKADFKENQVMYMVIRGLLKYIIS